MSVVYGLLCVYSRVLEASSDTRVCVCVFVGVKKIRQYVDNKCGGGERRGFWKGSEYYSIITVIITG